MSGATTSVPTDRAGFVRHVETAARRRAFRSMVEIQLLVGAGFWVVLAVVGVAVPLIVDRAGNEMDTGVLGTGGYSARWFAFSLGLIMIATIGGNHVAAGGTRRALLAATAASAVVAGVFHGVTYAVAEAAERALFGALDWTWQAPDYLVVGDSSGFLLTVSGATLGVAAFAIVGAAVAVAYQHHGPWRGTLMLLPNLVLLALVELVGQGYAAVFDPYPAGTLGVATALLAGAAVVVLAAGWLHLNLRTLPIRPTR